MLPVTVNILPHLEVGTFFRITSVGSLISGILNAALVFASIAFVLYFVWGAFRWLTAGGDKTQIENARSKITNAFIGLTLVAITWAIYILVIYLLGLGGAINLTGGSEVGDVGNGLCGCSDGGCAVTGQIGPYTLGGPCSICTDTGWVPVAGDCSPISCASCP